jgi:hypothetical protein
MGFRNLRSETQKQIEQRGYTGGWGFSMAMAEGADAAVQSETSATFRPKASIDPG